MIKVCTSCHESKEESEFYKSVAGSHCKACYQKRSAEWYRRNIEYITSNRRDRTYRRKYGISFSDVEAMLEACPNCPICQVEMHLKGSMDSANAVVDHCHTTDKVRSLLCNVCNAGLGHFKDSIINLERAISYLKDHKH